MASSKDCSWEFSQTNASGQAAPVYVCRPNDDQPTGAVILLHEIFGVNQHMMNLAGRLSTEGYVALVPDLFYRQGAKFTCAYTQVKEGLARAKALTEDEFLADIDGLLRKISQDYQLNPDSVAVLGFCMGGRLAYLAAATKAIGASVAFYGGGIAQGPVKKTANIQCPVLLFFGGKDAHIPPADVDAIRVALAAHEKQAEVTLYPDADHGFFCDERPSYHAVSAQDSWEHLLDFFSKTI